MKKNTYFVTLYMVLIILFTSCDLFTTTVNVKFDQKTFNEQRQLWQASNVKNYQYQFYAMGFDSYRGTIIVENGIFKNDITSDEYDHIEYFMDYSNIDEIYKTIEKSFYLYNNTKQSINDFYYTEISVKYDKINHIPVKINYNYYNPPAVAVDGTFYYEVNNFSKSD
jgi:hypothetical protein